MNWDTVAGNWTQCMSAEQWGNRTDDHLETIARQTFVRGSTVWRMFLKPIDSD